MSHSEATTSALIERVAAELGYTLLRNNVGAARTECGRIVRFGLGNISSQRTRQITSVDWIGWRDRDGKFTAVEAKRGDWIKPSDPREIAQQAFIDLVLTNGGIAGFVRNESDLRSLLDHE